MLFLAYLKKHHGDSCQQLLAAFDSYEVVFLAYDLMLWLSLDAVSVPGTWVICPLKLVGLRSGSMGHRHPLDA